MKKSRIHDRSAKERIALWVVCMLAALFLLSVGVSAVEGNVGAANQAARFEAESALNQLIIGYQSMEPDVNSERWGGVERDITKYGKNKLNDLVSDERYQTDSLIVEIELYRAAGTVAGEVAWIYYTYLPVVEEGRRADVTTAYETILREIGEATLTSQTEITRSFRQNGFVARMYVAIYDEMLDALLKDGDSEAVTAKVTAAKQALRADDCLPVTVEGQVCTSAERYQEIFAASAQAVKVQRWQDTAMTYLTDVFAILYPEVTPADHESLQTALALLDDDATDTVEALNAAMTQAISTLLDELNVLGGGYVSAYIEGVEAQMAEVVAVANAALRMADVRPVFKNHDMTFSKAAAKDALTDYVADKGLSNDGKMKDLTDTYNRNGGLFDTCGTHEAIDYELDRAKLRVDLRDEYVYARDIITEYGGDDGEEKQTLLDTIEKEYLAADAKLATNNPMPTWEECRAIYEACIAVFDEAAAKAEVVAFMTKHKEIIEKPEGEVTVADKTKLDAAIAGVAAMNDRARDILLENEPLVAASLANKYVRVAKEQVQAYLEGTPRNDYVLALKDALDGKSLPGNDPDHLAALAAEIDVIVRKAACIDRVYDALEAIAATEAYASFADDSRRALKRLADDAAAALVAYEPQAEEDELAALDALADEAVKEMYRLTAQTMHDLALAVIEGKGFLFRGTESDADGILSKDTYAALMGDALQEALQAMDGTRDPAALTEIQQVLAQTLAQLQADAAEDDETVRVKTKADALSVAQTAYDEAVACINGTAYLSEAQRAELLARAQALLNAATEQVNQATNSGGVLVAANSLSAGMDKLMEDTEAAEAMAKEALRTAVTEEVRNGCTALHEAIDGMVYLPQEKKVAFRQAVTAMAEAFATALSSTSTPTEAEQLRDDALAQLSVIEAQAKDDHLVAAKNTVEGELTVEYGLIQEAVVGYTYLNDSERAALTTRLNGWRADATSAVRSADSVEGVRHARDTYLRQATELAEQAQAMEDEACVRTLTPVLIVLACILVAELLALGVLFLLRRRQKNMMQVAAYAPVAAMPVMALALTPVSAWAILWLMAVADAALIPVIVWMAMQLWKHRIVVQLEAEDGIRILEEPVSHERKKLPHPGAVARLETPKLIYLMPPAEVMPETVQAITMEEADELISDQDALNCEESGLEDAEVYHGRKKAEINIDVLSRFFKAGDVITLNSMKRKGLLPRSVGYVKVLARGRLDKPLTVIAQGFSASAVKMIVLTGGKAVLTEGAPERWTWRRTKK